MTKEQKVDGTPQIGLQRIRNRIIEHLELASSFESQREYQSVAPIHVPNDIINQWEDWVHDARVLNFTMPVFSVDEQDAVARFHRAWDEVAGLRSQS